MLVCRAPGRQKAGRQKAPVEALTTLFCALQAPRHPAAVEQPALAGSGPAAHAAAPATVHHVVHPLFSLQLQANPLAVRVQAAAGAALAAVEARAQEGGQLEATVSVAPENG